MILTGDLYHFLTAAPSIGAVIGTRCYPGRAPQAVSFPALTYHEIDATRVRDTLGPAHKVRRRISINSLASSHTGAVELSELVRLELDGFRGMMGATEVGSTFLITEIAFFEEEAGTVGIYRVMQDYQIGHLEA